MNEESTLDILRELQLNMQKVKSMHDLFALEIYCTISARLLGWIKHLGFYEELAFKIGIMNLYNVSLHANWQEAYSYLLHVTESIFALKK